MVSDVEKCIQDRGLSPDMILVTGDIAYSGEPAEYGLVVPFFEKLLSVTDLGKDRLFLVPGNHDVSWDLISQRGLQLAHSLVDSDAITGLMLDSGDRRQLLRRLDHYVDFVASYLDGNAKYDCEDYFDVRSILAAGHRVEVLGLNSAWLASGGHADQRRLAVGEHQVHTAICRCANATIRIALVHHPFDWLLGFDEDICRPLLMDSCGFILTGHRHRPDLAEEHRPYGSALFIGAGACYETRQHSNSYNWVRLDLETQLGEVLLRAWSASQAGFWTADARSSVNMTDGKYRFQLGRYLVKRHMPELL